MLVVQEIFGVHEHIKDLCRRLAHSGYCAIAPDLYVRQGDVTKIAEMEKIMPIVASVPDAQVMSDLDATLAWAGKSGQGNPAKAVITGFCWGGRITWLYAAHNPKIKAGVAWYGRIVARPTRCTRRTRSTSPRTSRCRCSASMAARTPAFRPDTVEQMRKAVPASAHADFQIYPNAPHGFNADYRPSYRADAALDGWQRMLTWFKTHGAGADRTA
ncbi:MAG: dienelactone hydrolase family protein [Pseudomonadota bacterium]